MDLISEEIFPKLGLHNEWFCFGEDEIYTEDKAINCFFKINVRMKIWEK